MYCLQFWRLTPKCHQGHITEKCGFSHYCWNLQVRNFVCLSPGFWWFSGNCWQFGLLLLLLFSHSVVSTSLRPHGLQPTRLLSLSMEFPRQESWSRLPFPPLGWGGRVFPTRERTHISRSPKLKADSLPLSHRQLCNSNLCLHCYVASSTCISVFMQPERHSHIGFGGYSTPVSLHLD